MNAFSKLALATTLCAAAGLASAQDHAHAGHGAHDAHGAHGAQAGAKATAAAELVDGEVKKIDKGAGKITLRHGELKSLNMPAMSMVFRVKDAAMLDQVKTGDKVKFAADRVNGAVTIVELKPAQ
ncbi:copper-binding protein [Massilia jejuensis]|uniref:Copper-binding protein n=1 Tax=Massilia jejuensis TaxID=648894 RepID=A0ABW0PFJ3_9BURK